MRLETHYALLVECALDPHVSHCIRLVQEVLLLVVSVSEFSSHEELLSLAERSELVEEFGLIGGVNSLSVALGGRGGSTS